MDNECESVVTAHETPEELRARLDALAVGGHPMASRGHMRFAVALVNAWPEIDALLAENVQLRQLADLVQENFPTWLIENAPELYRAITLKPGQRVAVYQDGVEVWYLAICDDCYRRAGIPPCAFRDEVTRDSWADEHRQFGHTVRHAIRLQGVGP
jgi:hypothetical protein